MDLRWAIASKPWSPRRTLRRRKRSTLAKPIPALASADPRLPATGHCFIGRFRAHPVESAPCHAEAKPCLPRTADEIWLISTRCLGCPDVEAATPDYGVWRYDLNAHQWNHATLQGISMPRKIPTKPDVVWVHGYRIDAAEAEEQGLGVYEQLTVRRFRRSSHSPDRLFLGRHALGQLDRRYAAQSRPHQHRRLLPWLAGESHRSPGARELHWI